MKRPGVTGVGVGQNKLGEPCILVYVRSKADCEDLPRDLDGIDVVCAVTGEIDAY